MNNFKPQKERMNSSSEVVIDSTENNIFKIHEMNYIPLHCGFGSFAIAKK